ncbi:fumarylacetoacetate hydrolase family protein [Aestuariispira insulae]|uniref:2,4-diketo-3-deoxy-L-fuconate hydrolase n=1 Tax=Aestuariispira insulae TaxID=1461337 RepID=A0A3D9HNS9_9PROT|nr:fumarylacetoacetate hydrolase family protein [Aestuariispira insulae]RED50961.1 2,4-diketo-3-deoxy-L-fuconate hydrolase [Aestuariispira insulae]
MKLVRFGHPGEERPGLIDQKGEIRDLSGHIGDIDPAVLDDASLNKLRALKEDELPLVQEHVRLGCCVTGVGKIICIGLNYLDHVKEAGMQVPEEPVVFMKATSALTGPNDNIILPRNASRVDWEAELAVIIGKKGKYIEEANALEHVAGYAVFNDISERHFQLDRGGQWVKGKSADSFAPLGPWLVTRDEIADPSDLAIWQEIDGNRFQDSHTGQMIFKVPLLISYLSRFMSLHPGDVIATGTPPGVGMGMAPPVYLRAGNKVELGIEGLGRQSHYTVEDD